jgi:ubiquinone/menaquinone biosynthesis C-methylase UbiE
MASDEPYQPPDIAGVWDKVAATYGSIDPRAPDYQAYHQHLLGAIGSPAGRSICEVGCGSGTTSALLASLGASITLVDLAERSLRFAREHFDRLGLGAEYARMNGLRMAFRDGAFDVVWNGGVIEHFTDEGKTALLAEMWRVTKPGGLLLVTVPNARDYPFMAGKTIARWRGKWIFGFEDDLTEARFRALARAAAIPGPEFGVHNPVVGWWFLPWGRSLTRRLGLDTPERHARASPFGHVITLTARRPT